MAVDESLDTWRRTATPGAEVNVRVRGQGLFVELVDQDRSGDVGGRAEIVPPRQGEGVLDDLSEEVREPAREQELAFWKGRGRASGVDEPFLVVDFEEVEAGDERLHCDELGALNLSFELLWRCNCGSIGRTASG